MPTHGSLSKAGRVRSQTPKIEKSSKRKSTMPRTRLRKLYVRRILINGGKHP